MYILTFMLDTGRGHSEEVVPWVLKLDEGLACDCLTIIYQITIAFLSEYFRVDHGRGSKPLGVDKHAFHIAAAHIPHLHLKNRIKTVSWIFA
jgi:hypothetical protein